jgi:hypothetical protein
MAKKTNGKAESWKKVSDKDVRHEWRCNDEKCKFYGSEGVYVDPSYYQKNGTPMCEGDHDMSYIRTEIRN